MKKLNIGSGEFPLKGYINLDYYSNVNANVIHNLNVFPFPFKDNEFDVIYSSHCLEHLDDPFQVMKEIHRIGKDGGIVVIKVPHFSRGFTHPEHKRGFDVTFPLYFKQQFKGGYQGCEFILQKVQLKWFAQKYLKKSELSFLQYNLAVFFGSIFNFFANLAPFLCSRIWCFWVGGFEEVSFKFIIKKK